MQLWDKSDLEEGEADVAEKKLQKRDLELSEDLKSHKLGKQCIDLGIQYGCVNKNWANEGIKLTCSEECRRAYPIIVKTLLGNPHLKEQCKTWIEKLADGCGLDKGKAIEELQDEIEDIPEEDFSLETLLEEVQVAKYDFKPTHPRQRELVQGNKYMKAITDLNETIPKGWVKVFPIDGRVEDAGLVPENYLELDVGHAAGGGGGKRRKSTRKTRKTRKNKKTRKTRKSTRRKSTRKTMKKSRI